MHDLAIWRGHGILLGPGANIGIHSVPPRARFRQTAAACGRSRLQNKPVIGLPRAAIVIAKSLRPYMNPAHRVTSIDQLEAIYGHPAGAAVWKEIDHISAEYRAFIEAAPFFALSTCGAEGVDCSPRGDEPGFVRVADEKTLMIPDRRGNNRVDSLRNIVRDPRVSLLFLVPGVGETFRVIGRAKISTDPALTESLMFAGNTPRSVIVVAVERVYYQCSKAIIRSKLWDA